MEQNNIIILIGLPAVGKTSIAEKLSLMFDIPYVDIDSEIENDQNSDISELIHTQGEGRFRVLEKNKLKETVQSNSAVIISAGGGVVLDYESRALIRGVCEGIYLKCDIHQIADRLNIANRPLLYNTSKIEQLGNILKEREKFYKEVSKFEIDITGLGVREAAQRIYSQILKVERI